MIEVETMKGEDRETLCAWYDLRMKEATNQDLRFERDWIPWTGLAARDETGRTLAICAVYFERETPVAVCGWCATNPETTERNGSALEKLFAVLPLYAERNGARHLLTTFGDAGLNRLLDRLGWIGADPRVEHKYMPLRAG